LWFWDKYSAHPYIGCEHGCEYCYNILGRESERKAAGNLAAGHSEEITD
jgi:DNA repair photolyase